MTRVFMFPGQSSRDPSMLERARRMSPRVAARVLEEASAALGRDLARSYQPDDPAIFATNRSVQVGVFVTNHIHLEALRDSGIDADVSLGLSLGEYNHLVHIGAIDFADALRLVDERGRIYDEGPTGAMLAVFPVDAVDLEEIVARSRAAGALEIANLNSPTQHVLAGDRAAIDEAARLLDEELGVAGVLIEDRVPMHSSMFRPAADALLPALTAADFRLPERSYLPNVLGRVAGLGSPAEIARLLHRHVFSTVRWRESIEHVAQAYQGAVFVEVGPRAVLHGLLSRRWIENPRFKTDAADEPERAFASTVAELARAA